ncbi:hypothetical protein J6524_04795 [Bradyrhizobium sp. WSM 1738]|uniref:hypothetical protein n=1 Tax=Bradyrhizobium hereditatis TaxID=2821405 RepID=UPI001CE33182|nr:hypothetical protein [Bradyrhizobium hereditatis]MCA6114247.1 hypothetical protein [Bradyrhizobium hereditatis]
MAIVPFGEYRPDVSDYQARNSQSLLNVVPRGDGYGPFPSLAAISQSLGLQCRGALAAYKNDGSVVVFAATATDLYLLNNTTYGWSKVSKGGGPYAAIPTADQWQFAKFNNLVIAVQVNVAPQVFDITTSSAFADLAGNPPQARYIGIVGKFAVLTGLLNNPGRVKWSGLNDVNGPNSWTAGINSSDEQDLVDGGICRGIAGGESGVLLQDTVVRRMIYLPGDPRVFQIEKIAEELGLYGPYSLIRSGPTVFFYSLKGFHKIDPGGVPVPIGRERVDRTFFKDLDAANLQLFLGVADPRSSRVLWFYKSVNGSVNQFDKALCYDPVLDRFTPLRVSGEFVFSMAQPGITLEALDALAPGGSLDAMTQSLDSFQSAIVPELAAFDGSHLLNFFRGPNLEATLETAEQGTDGRRVKMKVGFRPVSDATAVYGSASRRENLQQAVAAGSESLVNAKTGICNMRVDTRYSRFKCRIPAGAVWTFINGVEPADLKATGKR